MDELRLANWQRGNAGRKSRSSRPKPISPLAHKGHTIGRTDRKPAEVAAVLARYGPRREVTDAPSRDQ